MHTGISHKSLLGAGGSEGNNTLVFVSECRNFNRLFKHYLTYRALSAVCKTVLGTACRLAFYNFIIVAECLGLIAGACLTAYCTGVSGITAVQAIGSGYKSAFLMSECGSLVAGIGLAASVTGEGGVAALKAVGISNYLVVAVRGNCEFIISGIITSCALYVCIPADSGTSGCLCLVRNLVMTEC